MLYYTVSAYVGLEELREEINSDQSDFSINELCKYEKGEVTYLSFQSGYPLDEITMKVDIMLTKFPTDLFRTIWKFHMKTAIVTANEEERELLIEDIKLRIWEPAFKECMSLLDSLQDQSIKLIDVDHYFWHIKDRELQLRRLYNGVKECIDGGTIPNAELRWLHTAVKLMDEYWSLLNLASAATTLMILKDGLGLSGDFTLIQAIAEKVCIA